MPKLLIPKTPLPPTFQTLLSFRESVALYRMFGGMNKSSFMKWIKKFSGENTTPDRFTFIEEDYDILWEVWDKLSDELDFNEQGVFYSDLPTEGVEKS